MKALTFLMVVLVSGFSFAGPLQFTDASIQTNGAVQVTLTPDGGGNVHGWIDTVIVDITAGASDTNTITLTTLAGKGTGAARTLLTLSNVSADGVYPVRDLVTTQAGVDIANTPARMPLQGDRLRLTAIASGSDTNAAATFTLYVITTDEP